MKTLRLGTRKSALAQVQARWVADQLRQAHPDLNVELVLITTTGDLPTSPSQPLPSNPLQTPTHGLQTPPASRGGLKALFTKEIEDALLTRQIDVAVHSLKDMAVEIPEGLKLAAVPVREDPRDVWISRRGIPFKDVRVGATIATSAIRRQAQLRHLQPDLELVSLRGNVDTRLQKLKESDYDGIILALAGLKRLGRESEATEILSLDMILPAVGQGALAIETRGNDTEVLNRVQRLDDPASHLAVRAERAFLKALGGSCQTPIAAYAKITGKQLTLRGLVVAPSGNPYLQYSDQGPTQDPEVIGHYVAQTLLGRGANKILS